MGEKEVEDRKRCLISNSKQQRALALQAERGKELTKSSNTSVLRNYMHAIPKHSKLSLS